MNNGAAIVVTLTNAEDILGSFITYHLKLGFRRLYLFFDKPDDPSIKIAEKFPQVKVIRNDLALHEQWKLLRTYNNHSRFIATEVMSRQVMNAEVAIRMALEEEIGWLLHIDVDELFYSPTESVDDHFSELDSEGFTHATYLNYEAVPTQANITDFFKDVVLFKKHKAVLTDEQLQYCNRQEIFNFGNDYFWYYENGKSAVKISDHTFPDSVHSFSPRTNFTVCEEPLILHYPICGFEHFWLKYKTLGQFGDKWFDNLPIKSSMHLKGRDIIGTQSKEQAEQFYNDLVSGLAGAAPALLQREIFCRIDGPAKSIATYKH